MTIPRLSLSILAVLAGIATSGAARSGEFMERVPSPGGIAGVAVTNERGYFEQLGEVSFGDSVVYTRLSSQTGGVTIDGSPLATVRTYGWSPGSGRTRHDNPVFGQAFPCAIKGYSMTLDRVGDGRGRVRLDFSFTRPVSDLKVLLFDIDEGGRSYPEKINLSASNADGRVYDQHDWYTVAQGDLTESYDRSRDVHLTVPRIYVPDAGPNLVVESRTYANENRDFTVLQLPASMPIKQVRVQFVGSGPGDHAYVALYRGALGRCG